MTLAALKALSFVLALLPMRAAGAIGRLLGGLAYSLLKRHRQTALENIGRAFPGASAVEKERIARAAFRNLATISFEFIKLAWLKPRDIDRLVDFLGLENFDKALARGKGVMLVTAHFGNWELLGASLGHRGYALDIVVRELDNPLFEEFVSWVRTRSGNRIVYKNRAMRRLIKSLAANSIVGILVDQNVALAEGIFVDFFGVPACTNKGPAHLALASGAAVVPAFIVRDGGRHRVEVLEELELASTGDRARDAIENTRRFTQVVEEMIRRHPDQWFWVHRRWKTRPEPGQEQSGPGAPEKN